VTEVVSALSKSCVASSCELAQRSVAQLLNLRKESCAKMAYDLVARLRVSADAFALDVGQCSGSKCYELLQAITSLSKLHIEATHESNKTKLVAVCTITLYYSLLAMHVAFVQCVCACLSVCMCCFCAICAVAATCLISTLLLLFLFLVPPLTNDTSLHHTPNLILSHNPKPSRAE
jgi:hypothetical protein